MRAVGNSSGRDAVSGRPGMYDNFSSVLTFPGGRYATITQSLAGFEHHMVLEITGDDGALRSWWSGGDARSLAPSFALSLMRGAGERAGDARARPLGRGVRAGGGDPPHG